MRELSTPELSIDAGELMVADDGTASAAGLRLSLPGLMINDSFRPVVDWILQADVDEINLEARTGGLLVEQRHGADGIWNWRMRISNLTDEVITVQPVLEIAAAEDWTRRAWLAGLNALIAILPPVGIGPLWVVRPRLGTLSLSSPEPSGRESNGSPPELAGAVVMATRSLAPGEQYVVQWRAEQVIDPAAAAALLPPWLPDRLELEPGAELGLELPDAAVVDNGAEPGVHQVLVHQGSGTSELTVSVPYRLDSLIEAVAAQAEQRGVTPGAGRIAEALVLLHAAARGAHPDAVALAEDAAQRLPLDDPLAVIAAATGASTAGWYDGVVPPEVTAAAQQFPGPAGDLARMHVRGAALLLGEPGAGPPAAATSAEQILVRLGAGLPGESDNLTPEEVGELLAWAATQPDGVWSQLIGSAPGSRLAGSPGTILDRAQSWALARLEPAPPFSATELRAIAWLAIHQQLVRG